VTYDLNLIAQFQTQNNNRIHGRNYTEITKFTFPTFEKPS